MVFCDRKVLYNTVLSQTISSCGKYLFAGNNFGDIFVLSIKHLQNTNEDDIPRPTSLEPIQTFTIKPKLPVNSLAFHRDFLIVGTVGSVAGYVWDSDKSLIAKKQWDINIPSTPESIEPADINHFWLDNSSDLLYAGCGDNLVYQINLEDGKITRKFNGHKDFIHCVAGWENRLFSASEDGNILFWDVRDEKQVGKLEPYKSGYIARPEYGRWQGTVSVTNDWLVCGGGPKMSMWHLRSLECTNVLPFPDKAHCSGFLDDMIIVAGEHSFLHQYSFNAEITAEVPVSGASVYSVVWQNEPVKLMSIAGASNCLDLCTNFNYKDMVVKLYTNGKRGC